MKWQWLLRPIALPAFLVSLLFIIVPFGPAVTVAGAVFYGLAIYRAYKKDRDRALPSGLEDDVGKLPYKRRRLAELAIAAARDVERRLSLLPRDLASRIPVVPAEAGKLAGGVVFYLNREADALALVRSGAGGQMDAAAKEAGAQAERLFACIQELQTALAAIAMEAADHGALMGQASRAAEEARVLTRAMDAARRELSAAPTGPALPSGGDDVKGGGNR